MKLKSFILQYVPKTIRDLLSLIFASASNHAVKLITGVINAKLLTPYLYAINTIVITINRYVSFIHLGAQNGLNRKIPISIGKGDIRDINKNLMNVFWFLLILAVFINFIFLFLIIKDYNFKLLPSEYFVFTSLVLSSSLFVGYFTSYLICIQKFELLSKIKFWYENSLSLAVLVLVFFFKLKGLLAGIFLGNITYCIIVIFLSDFSFEKTFCTNDLLKIIKVGFPIMLGSFIYVCFITIDIVFLSGKLNQFEIGIYGFAVTGVVAFRAYVSSFSDILSPKIGFIYGESGNKFSLYEFMKKYNVLFIFGMSFVFSIFYFTIPAIIESFLNEYIHSMNIYRVLLIGAFALSLYLPSGIVLNTLKKNWIYVLISLFFVVLTYILFILVEDNFLQKIPIILACNSLLFSLVIIACSSFFTTIKFNFVLVTQSFLTFCSVVFLVLLIDKISIYEFFNSFQANILINAFFKIILTVSIFCLLILYFCLDIIKEFIKK